jgi:sodium/proline symporter
MNSIFIIMLLYFALMLGIGYWSSKRVANMDDYAVGGRGISIYVTAIAHQAAALSGFLFFAWSGQVAGMGIAAIWTAIASGCAPITNFAILARRMRRYTGMINARSIIDLLEARYYDEDKKIIRIISVIIIFVCMSVYTGSQIMAAGKAFQLVMGWDYTMAVFVGALIVIAYTSAGGFMAIVYTDMIQGLLMIFAVVSALALSLSQNNGFSNIVASLDKIDPNLMNPWINPLTIIGLLSAGFLGYLGQPQIIQMFMGMKDENDAKKGIFISGIVSLTLFFGSFVALLGAKVLFTGTADPDTNFIELFRQYAPASLVGIVMASCLAAVMSSADALLHVANTSVVQDLYNKVICNGKAEEKKMILVSRVTAIVIGLVAIFIALNPFESIIWVIWWAWGGLTTFGPIIVVGLYWKRATREGAIAGLICGFTAAVVWFQSGMYKVLHMSFVSFFTALIVLVVVSLLTKAPSEKIQNDVEALKGTNKVESAV